MNNKCMMVVMRVCHKRGLHVQINTEQQSVNFIFRQIRYLRDDPDERSGVVPLLKS